ncbi:hypothetical protein [Peribacillus sp. NPDC060253]|uniref:hypothetical protein n=1 Tax=Peribacillus sp. NPDC060253 TaxID=3347084 RepID=UPI00365F4FB6
MDISSIVTNQLKQLNLYLIPSYLWLFLLYYLIINSLITFFEYMGDFGPIIKKIPKELLSYNNIIMRYLDMWVPLFGFFGLVIFIAGVIVALIQFLPYIGNYKMTIHGAYGISLGIWFIIIWATYKSYVFLDLWFLLLLPGIICIVEGVKKLRDRHYFKYG